jgi:hypothetical protein
MDRLEAMSIVLAVVEEGSLGEVLPSTVSAEKTPLLFDRFIGTTPSSDSSSACMLIVRLLPA